MSRSTAILVWVASLLLLTWVAVALRHEAIALDLGQRVDRALASHAITGIHIAVDGRDVSLSGELPAGRDAGALGDIAAQTWGVRTVDTAGLVPVSSPHDPDDPLSARFDTGRIVRLGGDLSNPMSAGVCQRTMARLASLGSVLFESGGASPMIDSYPLLNDLAKVAYQCPDTRLVIGGHTDGSGDRRANLRLSQARAEAVERFFYLAGIPLERMQTIAYGDSQPIASDATPEGRAANRRISFQVLPAQ